MVNWFDELSSGDTAVVGGKNASLGEMIQNLSAGGILVPNGFAITAYAYRHLLAANNLGPRISEQIDALHKGADLAEVGNAVRQMYLNAVLPSDLARAIQEAYRELAVRLRRADPDVAVRSSATAEDLPEPSFAGQ
jgi:pyruvate,water dikinase